MKAMIFAAGMGTRLKPITDTLPKALVPIAGKTLLERVIGKLADAGFAQLVINVHHFGEQIISFLDEHRNFGLDIQVSDERGNLLDTGGGIRKAAPLLAGSEPFLIHNVDILSNVDLAAVYREHLERKADVSLLVSERETQRYLLFDERQDERLMGWTNIATGDVKSPYPDFEPGRYRRLAFAGIHVMGASALQHMQSWPDKFPIMDFYLAEAAKLNIKAQVAQGLEMVDVGKLYAIEQAEDFVGKHPQ